MFEQIVIINIMDDECRVREREREIMQCKQTFCRLKEEHNMEITEIKLYYVCTHAYFEFVGFTHLCQLHRKNSLHDIFIFIYPGWGAYFSYSTLNKFHRVPTTIIEKMEKKKIRMCRQTRRRLN